jgi:1-aminocyclopropane-1-carboxylate deaminase/D-cysteine desulfhydrase-like pyridoxal-dependent ACC family enzyme
VGAVGYHLAAAEVVAQLGNAGVDSASIVVCVGSGGTLGGIVSGMSSLGVSWPLFGASVSRDCDEGESQVDMIAAKCARLLASAAPAHRFTMVDARGPGYGQTWIEAEAASDLAHRCEGLVLDSIYTGKAFAALVRLTIDGLDGPLVFWHTGGTATAIDDIANKEWA